MVFRSFFAALACIGAVQAVLPDGRLHANVFPKPALPIVNLAKQGPVTSRNGTELPPYNTWYYFNQLIDHTNPSLGTFVQRYYFTYEKYEPGGPIILMTPGEANAERYYTYLTNSTINGLIAQQQNAATVVLEHRFYGLSNPYPDLSAKSLRVHTIQQAIDDLEYFTKNVKLPMPGGDQVKPGQAPWILIGGSYSGALTAWTMYNKPGLFWAGYSSSGVVQAITDYWRYFEPIRQNMDKNCSSDVQAAIAYIDKVFSGNDKTAIVKLKDTFGLTGVTHLDDAAGALRNNLWDWQSLQPRSGNDTLFRKFCDALEVDNGKIAPATGFGTQHAVAAWGAYFKNQYLPLLCGNNNVEDCLGSYDRNSTFYTNTTVDNVWRSWNWIVCNEVGYLQDGPPNPASPAVVTRLVRPPYDARQCEWFYPGAFKTSPPFSKVELTNTKYKGWNLKADRLFVANGLRDPWREATHSAQGLNIPSTPQMPIYLSDGFHCSDLSVANGLVDSTVLDVQKAALASMKAWLATWKPSQQQPAPKEVSFDIKAPTPEEVSPAPTVTKSRPLNAFVKSFGEV